MKKVGFIGLGIMEKPMAHNLLKAGADLMVCDLNQEAVDDHGGYVQYFEELAGVKVKGNTEE